MTLASEPTGSLEQALAHAGRLLATDPALAAAQASEILKVVRNHPQATLLLGASHTARGDSKGAVQVLAPLAASHPNWARAHLELGLALGRAGRGEQAVAALQRAVSLNPELPSAWRALGDHRAAMGDGAGADAAYANHIRYSTRDPALLTAATALCENRIPEAEALLRAHLLKAPTDVAAIRMLAEVAARLGRHEDAETLLARCLELAPSFHAARQNYALVLLSRQQARAGAGRARVACSPRTPPTRATATSRPWSWAASATTSRRWRCYAGLLEEYPGNAKIWLCYGHTLKTAGKQDAAIAAYRKSIELDPGFGEAYWSLANLKTFRFDADDIAAMRASSRAHGPRRRAPLPLRVLRSARRSRTRATTRPRSSTTSAATPCASAPCPTTPTLTSNAPAPRARGLHARSSSPSVPATARTRADPIFIVGLPRAGSTLLEQILSSHSAVEGTMELPEIISMTRGLRRQAGPGAIATYHDVLATLDADACASWASSTSSARGSSARRGAVLHRQDAEQLRARRPDPPGFAQRQDHRRAPASAGLLLLRFKQHFARGQNFTYCLDDIGRYYRDYVELMAHFDEVLPGRVHRVIYEHMVDDTEAEVRRLLDYCGLPFEAGCLRFFENERPVRTASSEQVRQADLPRGRRALAPLRAMAGAR